MQTGTAQDIVLRPADDYVAEFVRHMNPLTVLTGAMVMRAREQLERSGRRAVPGRQRGAIACRLDAGDAPPELRLDGEAASAARRG